MAKSCCDSRYRGPRREERYGRNKRKNTGIPCNENILQWRYVDDEIWMNLYDLSVLKGLDGDGADGINGKDGAAGKDGTNGQNGSDGKDGNTFYRRERQLVDRRNRYRRKSRRH